MMREVITTFAVGQPGGAQAAGVFQEKRGRLSRRRGAVTVVAIGPVLLLAARGRRPVTVGECSQVLGIHAAIVLGGQQQRMPTSAGTFLMVVPVRNSSTERAYQLGR